MSGHARFADAAGSLGLSLQRWLPGAYCSSSVGSMMHRDTSGSVCLGAEPCSASRTLGSCSRRRQGLRGQGVRGRVLIAFACGVLAALLCSRSTWSPAVISSRYHGGYDLYSSSDYGYGSPAPQQEMLLPPIAWLFKDFDRSIAACPVMLGLCMAAVGGYVLQHWLGRLLPFMRLMVFYPPTLKAGEVWRLFTHVLLHADMGHLLFNAVHVLNTLDLEGVPFGMGYPDSYSLGSRHVAGIAATTAAYGALVGSLAYWTAMFEGLSSVCFGLDGALFASCGVLLGSGVAGPSLQSFLQVRGLYALMHMGLDILKGCSSPGGTIGNISHLAGFIAGNCYVFAVMPDIGGRAMPTIPCLTKASRGWQEERCIAMFSTSYSVTVQTAQTVSMVVLIAGLVLAVVNAFLGRGKDSHASADGYSVLVAPTARGRYS